MARYGDWDDRERWMGEHGRERDAWRREDERRHERGGWRPLRDEAWREGGREEWRAGSRDERWETGAPRWDPDRRWEEERYEPRHGTAPRGERTERGGTGRPRPWVDAEELARSRGGTRGMYEWEDRGPLQWLHDRGEKPRGPKGYRRSDERVQDEVCERIARSGVNADDVEVKVENGRVTLTGTVQAREWKWRLEDVADDVYGVDEVHNELRVTRAREERGGAGDPNVRFRQ